MADFGVHEGPATVGSIVAQGDSESTGCRFVVDGVVIAESSSHEVVGFTVCLLKGA